MTLFWWIRYLIVTISWFAGSYRCSAQSRCTDSLSALLANQAGVDLAKDKRIDIAIYDCFVEAKNKAALEQVLGAVSAVIDDHVDGPPKTALLAACHFCMGLVSNRSHEDYVQGWYYFMKAESLYEEVPKENPQGLGKLYYEWAISCHMMRDIDKAKKISDKLGQLASQLNDTILLKKFWNVNYQIAFTHKNYSEALDMVTQSLAYNKRYERVDRMRLYYAIDLSNMAEVYQMQQKYQTAESLFHKALALHQAEKNYIKQQRLDCLIEADNDLGELYFDMKNYPAAIDFSRRAYDSLKSNKNVLMNKRNEHDIAINLYRLYQEIKDSIIALPYLKRAYEIKDTLYTIELQKNKRVVDLQLELIRAEEHKEVEYQRLFAWSATLVGLLVTLLALLLWRSNRLKQQANQVLTMQRDLVQVQKTAVESLNTELDHRVQDRTRELNQTVVQLLQQNDDLEQFSFIISHNMRGPVARLQGLVGIFDWSDPQAEVNREIVGMIKKTSLEMDEVIRDLSTILSVRRSISASREMVDLAELVAQELGHLSQEIASSGCTVQLVLAAPTCLAIKPYVQSIFFQLLTNAIKFRHPDRPLQLLISTKEEAGYFYLQVEDNGLGVDLTDPYKIFGLYQRMHLHVEGKGLGLYLASAQVKAMDGKLTVESVIDQGSTFTVKLPLSSSQTIRSASQGLAVGQPS